MKRSMVGVVLVLLFGATAALAADRMRIAYSSISGAYVGIWVAHEAGLFASEGLDDQLIFIPSATQLAQVVVAGDVDVASLGGGPMMAAVLSGADLKAIGNNVNKLIFSIHARPEVKSIEDLRGKRIAVSRFGSSSDVSARYALRKHNLDPAERRRAYAVGLDVIHVRRFEIGSRGRFAGFPADSISFGEIGL
jgi:NitT/TauT family transport system substrate-binding protein